MSFGKFGTDREERINFQRMRDYRVARAKQKMDEFGLGCLITWDAWDIRYITGAYLTIPTRWTETTCAVLPRNGDPYLFGGSSGSPYRMREEMPWLKGRIYPAGRMSRMKLARTKDDVKNVVKEVADIMTEHGVKNEPLGIDCSTSELLLLEAFKEVGINIVDAKHVMFEARKIKNQDEIECQRIACSNAEAAFADIADAIRPGVTECELVGIGMNTLYRLGADEAQEFVCVSGPITNPFRVDFTDRQVRPGDLVIIDINGNSFHGYKSCYYRTFCCGKATQEQKDLYEICRKMMYDSMAAVKAGNTTWDVASKWPDSPKYWGYDSWEEISALAVGHGVGISLHEMPWFSYPMSKANPIKLEEGMSVALETWYGKRGGKDGCRLEEQMVITKDGYDLLTHYPVNELIECWT